ncbi:ubiquitin-conjugating enzyme E2 M [Pancytospora philotis]|nr:ubiquitin-conjugating enzyme E2 M [Pancytospora philotis]
MSFAKLRIQSDLDNMAIPISCMSLDGLSMRFSVDVSAELYSGTYRFTLLFPDTYPFGSPRLLCNSPVYHPNIDEQGRVCLRVLREGWMPSYTISSIVVSLVGIFLDPSGEDALNVEAGRLLEGDYEEFKRRVACSRLKAMHET